MSQSLGCCGLWSGENVEENANIFVHLLIQHPNCRWTSKRKNCQKAYLLSRCLSLGVVVVCDQERTLKRMPTWWCTCCSTILSIWGGPVCQRISKWKNCQKAYLHSRCLSLWVVVCDQVRMLRRMPTWWCACWSDVLSVWGQPCVERVGVCWRPWRMAWECLNRLLPAEMWPPPIFSLPWMTMMTLAETTWCRGGPCVIFFVTFYNFTWVWLQQYWMHDPRE